MNGRMALMSLTADVKDELARLRVDKMSARKAEVAATLRFAGGLHIISGRIVVEAELDTGVAARRLRQTIHEVYGHTSEVIVVSGGPGSGKSVVALSGTWSGWSPGERHWPGRRVCSTPAAARCAGCPRTW